MLISNHFKDFVFHTVKNEKKNALNTNGFNYKIVIYSNNRLLIA